jgi:putative transcriptional regulator
MFIVSEEETDMAKIYRSKVMAAIHETATDLYESGGMDKEDHAQFATLCLMPTDEMTIEHIPLLRDPEES